MSEVGLQFYNSKHNKGLESFALPEDQEQFSALPVNMLKKLKPCQYPIVILADQQPVGFFVLNTGDEVKEYTDRPDTMLLTALSINHSEQGKGYAVKAMTLLNKFINEEFPECTELVLAVNKRNLGAQKLYEKVGFTNTGRKKMGPIGEQLILSLLIK